MTLKSKPMRATMDMRKAGDAATRRMEAARRADNERAMGIAKLNARKAEQTANDGNAQNVATLTRQLHEARQALTIVQDMSRRAMTERQRGATIGADRLADILAASRIGLYLSSNESNRESTDANPAT